MEKLYNFIKSKGIISTNKIGMFIACNPECSGGLEKLIEEGKVEEIKPDLFKAK